MAAESRLQSQIIKWLKEQGCYVIKNSANPGVPAGCPDIVFFYYGFYGFLEVKSRKSAPYRPLQKETLDKLDDWSFARAVYPDNWPEIQKELVALFED